MRKYLLAPETRRHALLNLLSEIYPASLFPTRRVRVQRRLVYLSAAASCFYQAAEAAAHGFRAEHRELLEAGAYLHMRAVKVRP